MQASPQVCLPKQVLSTGGREDRALLIEYRALLRLHRALLPEYRALLIEYWALLKGHKALLIEYQALLVHHKAFLTEYWVPEVEGGNDRRQFLEFSVTTSGFIPLKRTEHTIFKDCAQRRCVKLPLRATRRSSKLQCCAPANRCTPPGRRGTTRRDRD